MTIHKPTVRDLPGNHSLAEISVYKKAPNGNQIEIGWTVDRAFSAGGTRPRLFIFTWVDGQARGYNKGCVPYKGRKVRPGSVLSPTSASGGRVLGIVHNADQNRWNLYYAGKAFCYFPDSRWDNEFNSAGGIQWYGEVYDDHNAPCSEMGNGIKGTDSGSARFRDIRTYDGAPDTPIHVNNSRSRDKGGYSEQLLTSDTFRYGGPGTC